jgi:cyclopropane fatty-acyl-phospholipid synthase-like methyltransferase
MIDTYRDIFNHRGQGYHQAMRQSGIARQAEFQQVIQLADLTPGMTIGDIPSGGSYLQTYLDLPTTVLSVETSTQFLYNHPAQPQSILCDRFSHIPLLSNHLDRIISLAGVHHFENQPAFYREAHRLLKPNGLFILADVQENTPVAHFLNDFVDLHNSKGHRGQFLSEKTRSQLQKTGFSILKSQLTSVPWRFQTIPQMTQFCQQLFGLDLATPEQILNGLSTYLGYQYHKREYHLNWELLFLQLFKEP